MAIGLEVAILPGFAIARRLDCDGDSKRHLMLSPAIGLLVCYGLAGFTSIFEMTLSTLTYLMIIANIVAVIAIRVELNPIPKTVRIERNPWFWIFTIIACFIAITPLTYMRPMGVDWIGFASLADAVSRNGGFILSEPSVGKWLYPPAFPTLAAWLPGSSLDGVFWLGVLSFVALLLGIAAVGEKMGCGHWTIMAMLLAPALFAKNLDSGYPTVASQLGLVVILLMFGEKLRWEIVAITTVTVAMIHPTGLIYLTTLILSQLIVSRSDSYSLTDSIQSLILGASIIIVLIALAPAFDGTAVFAEYGWQGGDPMLMYAGLLLPLGLWAAWTLRGDKNAMILTLWLAMNWVLSGVHIFDGLTGVTLLSMLSYALYSMSMHAFHIPLAALVGMRLSKLEGGISSDGGRAIMIATLLLCGIAHSALSELSKHNELHAISDGDSALIDGLEHLPEGSIVYAENEHWGHIYSIPEHIGITTVPTLGILKQEHSIQNAATTAIVTNDIERLKSLGITHAIASPKGVMMQYIQASTHWEKMWSSGASTLYVLEDDMMISDFIAVEGDNMRIDPWSSLRERDPFDLGDYRSYITEGRHTFAVNDSFAYEVCIMTEFVGEVSATINSREISGSGWYNTCVYAGGGGFEIDITSEPEFWINPLGASGRGDMLFDETGIRIHWIEIIYIA
ncbi:MAG: hypothetical protein ACPF9L_02325 [Candidatus Poseidoniaceae archaeon]